ncbi:MAG: DUF3667 domain-containing protein [Tenacibaculum sp.]
MLKKNKVAIIKDPNCLNCGYPFNGQEKFCPECGQKNKGNKLTFISFIKEVFNGFVTWDAKFWKTIIPLIIAPGKVSKDYIEGKRMRYANPFRFYLTVSLLFFLIIGITDSYNKFQDFKNGTNTDTIATGLQINANGDVQTNISRKELDSIRVKIFNSLEKNLHQNDSIDLLAINNSEKKKLKDSLGIKLNNIGPTFTFGDEAKSARMMLLNYKYPNLPINQALDSLKIEKNFGNRYSYSRAAFINNWMSNPDVSKQLYKQALSYASISLFILLPLFTLFLKFIYIRRKYTYVDHLVFVFHTQTVFFLLFSIFYIINFFKNADYIIPVFLLLFLIYLFIAMKKFYQQKVFKTIIKFLIINFVFVILAFFGSAVILLATVALY